MSVRNFQLKFKGNQIGSGRIPLNVLQKVFKGVQNAIYHIGEYHHVKSVTRERGPFPKEVLNNCTLELVSVGAGSFVAKLELPSDRIPPLSFKTASKISRLLTEIVQDDISE